MKKMNFLDKFGQMREIDISNASNKLIDLSVIIPIYNEEENLEIVINEVVKVLQRMKKSWEVIFVDDGSTDRGPAIIQKACQADRRIKLVQLRRNFGQTAAIAAGFDHSSGE